jgi:flagellar biosynthetic protein FliR
MEVLPLSLPVIQGFLICLVRVGSVFSTIPVFSGGQTPMQMRIGVAFLFAFVSYPVVRPYLPSAELSPLTLATLLLSEAALGLMVGFLGQLVFMAAEFGGSIIGYQMGFAAANVFDPANQRQVALISQFQSVFAILLFLVLDVHHLFLEAIVASFEMLQPGRLNLSGGAIPMLMEFANHSFILAIRLSAPILALLILSNLTLGIMARVFPQLNVFLLSYPLNIGVSFIVMGLTMAVVASLLQQEFSALADRFLQLFSLLS